ncbi:serine threonine-protein kinase [Stylonychia lemnae]|uniref:Serine threonine-protein kinase n=1 Tax=Stylonychia lemnae TaxID=5949 RepID=A0A078ACR6_STYLE|nr:serine threonine-protein kinase [Stylonychia lemnae]|eukprot:CDW78633.1 serine threonine-protein kinase [Stylonychia lemnae]
MEHLVQLQIKDTAERYRIWEKIGGGGQAVVYSAQDCDHPDQQYVALNIDAGNACDVISSQNQQKESENLAQEEVSRELLRLLREISSIQLKHLNIVEIYDSYISTDNKFISISELAHQDLQDFVAQRQKKLTTQEISMIFLQIINGLEYTHDQNFIHRDISPQNILVFQDQLIKICDSGLASYGDQSSLLVGKQDFVAPEIYFGSKNYNKSIDIWSLGITLYYLCTGSTYCNGELVNAVAREQNHIELPPEHKILQAFFDQMIQVDPSKRLSASKIKEDLMNIIDEGSPIFQKYQSSLLTYLMIQQKNNFQKQQIDFEKQIQRNFKKELIQQNSDQLQHLKDIYQELDKSQLLIQISQSKNWEKKYIKQGK